LYLVVREALNNVAKHAGASEVGLRVSVEGDSLAMAIADNGKGFDLAAARRPPSASPERVREGLDSMDHRLNAVGGRLEIQSHPGRGTVVRMVLPLSGTGGAP
jgi:signal transduction histidine kinase